MLSALLQRLKRWGGQPVSAQTIRHTQHQIGVHGSHPRRKPLLKMIHKKARKQFAEDMSTKHMDYWNQVLWSDEMKINLLVPMAFSMCGGNQMRSTKISVSCLQSSKVVGISWSGLHECSWCWRVTFHWGKHELQHVPWNTAAEHDPLPPETGSQGSVPAWQWPQTRLQDDHCFTEEAESKGDGLAKHVSRLEPNRTSPGDPHAESGGVQSLKHPPALRRRHGGVKEHSSGYLWSSGKLHVQESQGSSGQWWWPHKILTVDMVCVNIGNFP